MASKILKTIKEKLTPDIVHMVHHHHTALQVIWISSIFFILGFTLALFCLYNKILTLEAAIAVLAS
jgi:hypothetical protein